MTGPASADRGDLLVSGHINVDHFLYVRRFPGPDRTVPILSERRVLGGTAANIARVAAGYGVRTGLRARIGGDFPREFLRVLRASRIDTEGIEMVRTELTPTCYITVDDRHEQRTLIEQGCMADELQNGNDARTRAVAGYSWVHVTTGRPRWQIALAEEARRRGARVAADPAQEIHYLWDRGTLRRLLEVSEILFGNRHEVARAVELLRLRRVGDLLDFVPLVIETLGRRGVRAHSRSRTLEVPAAEHRNVRSFVGSGDAFRAGFYAGWFDGLPLAGALEAGTRAAARWIEGRSVPTIVAGPSPAR